MNKSEKIFKVFKKNFPTAKEIVVDKYYFWTIYDNDGKKMASGDLAKYTRGLGSMKKI